MSLLSLNHLLRGVSILLRVKCKCFTRSLMPYQALSDSPLHLPFIHYPSAIWVCFLSLKHGISFPSHDFCGCSYFCLNCSSPYFQMSTSFSSFKFQLQCHQLTKAFPEATPVTFHVFPSYLLHRTYQYLKFTYGFTVQVYCQPPPNGRYR